MVAPALTDHSEGDFPDSQPSESDLHLSDDEDDGDVPGAEIPAESRPIRTCRARAPRFTPEDGDNDIADDIPALAPRPRPRPRPIGQQVAPRLSHPSLTNKTTIPPEAAAPKRPKPRPKPRKGQGTTSIS